MLFNSPQFALFLPLVFCLYWWCGRNLRIQHLLIVLASCVFYGWWDSRFLVLIGFTAGWSYVFGLLELARWEKKASRLLLACSLLVNLGILGYFKYCDFFIAQAGNVLRGLGFEPHLPVLRIILPVGISFYTFQALSYTIDVYRRQIKPTRDPVAFFAFVSFFPQLVAGPIERASNLLPQFLHSRCFDPAAAAQGCRQMLWGFFKKMVVADNCALVADRLLDGTDSSNGFCVVIGILLFTIQIYGDFSGYSDIAIGCARLFGIRLMRNFAFPYFARDVAEFWRRWHISLTTWFRDYLYIPLGGSRCGRWRQVRNTFVIFAVSGFWHGANWTFICWGLFHAALFLPLLLGGRNRRHLDASAADRALPSTSELRQMAATFLLVALGWTFFRAPDMSTACRWLGSVVDVHSYAALPDIPMGGLWTALCGSAALLAVEWINRREQFGFSRMPEWRLPRWTLYYATVAAIFFLAPGGANFIYFQF